MQGQISNNQSLCVDYGSFRRVFVFHRGMLTKEKNVSRIKFKGAGGGGKGSLSGLGMLQF